MPESTQDPLPLFLPSEWFHQMERDVQPNYWTLQTNTSCPFCTIIELLVLADCAHLLQLGWQRACAHPARELARRTLCSFTFSLEFYGINTWENILRPFNTRGKKGSSQGEVAIQVYFISHFISRHMGRKRQNKPLKGKSTQNASSDHLIS